MVQIVFAICEYYQLKSQKYYKKVIKKTYIILENNNNYCYDIYCKKLQFIFNKMKNSGRKNIENDRIQKCKQEV